MSLTELFAAAAAAAGAATAADLSPDLRADGRCGLTEVRT